jgi:hypothetical protein
MPTIALRVGRQMTSLKIAALVCCLRFTIAAGIDLISSKKWRSTAFDAGLMCCDRFRGTL